MSLREYAAPTAGVETLVLTPRLRRAIPTKSRPSEEGRVATVTIEIQIRDVIESDFPVFFEHQCDAASAWMAAFGRRDPNKKEHAARWEKSLTDASTTPKAIVEGGKVVGFVASFMREGQLEVTYWIARSHWGRGVATAALLQLLQRVTTRPIYASAAKDNVASLRVLEKCGFTVRGSGRAFASARGEEIEEIFLQLR
jgi:RimJ/RimL family protein N-acetyltransferase